MVLAAPNFGAIALLARFGMLQDRGLDGVFNPTLNDERSRRIILVRA
jgi:hypothetical protein